MEDYQRDNDMEQYGMETDDWMMEETRKEYVDFSGSPGDLLVLFTGKPLKGRSKYGKDQFWFPVMEIDLQAKMKSEKILSTSSNQLRKRLTKLFQEVPRLFAGKTLVNIRWKGNGMERKYDVCVPAYESQRLVGDELGLSLE